LECSIILQNIELGRLQKTEDVSFTENERIIETAQLLSGVQQSFNVNLLGLTPESILLSDSTSNTDHALDKIHRSSNAATKTSFSTSSPADLLKTMLPVSAPPITAAEVAAAVSAVRKLHLRAATRLRGIAELAEEHLHIATKLASDLIEFMQSACLGTQQKIDAASFSCASQLSEAVLLKLQQLRTYFLGAAFRDDCCRALELLRTDIESKESIATTQLKQVLSSLSAYDALGPAFLDLAAEYGRVQAEVQQATYHLDKLQSLESDLENSYRKGV